MMVYMYIIVWVLGLILFFVVYLFYLVGRKGKGVYMGFCLMYIIIIVIGFMLYMSIVKIVIGSMYMWYGLKMLVGILVIGGMEMVFVKMSKNKLIGVVWGLFIVVLVVVFYFGLKLLIGWKVF